jgi:hypothetical protein
VRQLLKHYARCQQSGRAGALWVFVAAVIVFGGGRANATPGLEVGLDA